MQTNWTLSCLQVPPTGTTTDCRGLSLDLTPNTNKLFCYILLSALLQELVNRRPDAIKVQPVFSLLWTHCSSLKNKNATFVQSLENSVVILLKFLLEAESIISNAKLKSSCLRVATNFCVIYHQQVFFFMNLEVDYFTEFTTRVMYLINK